MQNDEKQPARDSTGASAAVYEKSHREIFNPIEQQRLHNALRHALNAVQTGSKPMTALDYGCGSGNLTRHLIELGAHVVSADVADDYLKAVEREFSETSSSRTLKVNGADLSSLPDAHFDLVATYSVLHHVRDYLRIVEELCRVTRPGGVVYIDHEVIPAYWQRPPLYGEFLRKARPRVDWRRLISLLLDVKGYVHIVRRLANPRYKREGDIHVWPDDHIEWDRIERTLASRGFETVLREDYLLCKAIYNLDVYNEYKDRCADERVLIARKRP